MKSESYSKFWQRLHTVARNKRVPLRAMFELTYRCNFRCKHCYVPQSYRDKYKNELKTKQIFSILDQLKDIGCFYLGFTGGEPFIREDILDILWYAKRCGFEIIIYTNGSLIDKKIANELKRLKPNKIDITIPAMSKDAFERITGLCGSRDKVFGAIELLHKNGVNLGFKTCLLKESKNEIKDIRDFSGSLGAGYRLDDMLSSRLDGSRKPYKYRGSLFKNVNIDECLNEDINVNLPAISENSPLFKCGVGTTQAAITPLGELKMCLLIDYPKYKILQCSLKDAWERLKGLVKNIKPNKDYRCDRCELETYCKWCPARGWLYNKKFTSCEPESYNRARITRIQIMKYCPKI